jgi:hypothetical protein
MGTGGTPRKVHIKNINKRQMKENKGPPIPRLCVGGNAGKEEQIKTKEIRC